jgi:hypothetical protein
MHKYTQHSIKKNERHKKTTYNKIAGKKEREQYVIKQIQTNKKNKNLNIPFVNYYL